MPPKKLKLPDAVIAALVAGDKMGAPDPRDGVKLVAKRGDASWWSLQPVATRFPHRRIDDFIEAALTAKGLQRSGEAEPRALIRRMTYDVTGLPPTAEEVAAFVAAQRADSDGAVAALADRLLASPRYGERWGRHWLDVIRFGESHGFERNVINDDLWPFRDYVIKSINEDRPFDTFIVEHLAGDVLGKDNPAMEVGSAFLVAGPYDDVGNQSVEAQANIRAATLDDIITATSGAFLGLTVSCARCHHHKFDPIPTEDYYRLRAAFEGVKHGRRVLATREERAAFATAMAPLNARKAQLTAELDALDQAIDSRARTELGLRTYVRPKIDPQQTVESFAPVPARYVRFTIRAFTSNPKPGDGPRPGKPGTRGAGRLTEFEVWRAGAGARNVALASEGAVAAADSDAAGSAAAAGADPRR